MGRFVGFRLRAKGQDRDIEKDLERFNDESERVREAYRIAMAVERGEYVQAAALGAVQRTTHMPTLAKPERLKPLDWSSLPKEPTVKQDSVEVDLKKNMLGGF